MTDPEETSKEPRAALGRRDFAKTCALGAAAVASNSIVRRIVGAEASIGRRNAPGQTFSLDQDWLFGGRLGNYVALQPEFDDSHFSRINLPHSVCQLSWQNWNPALWEAIWVYRRHLILPKSLRPRRVFLHFDGVMTGVTPVVNGHALPKHLGGYLPFEYELTRLLRAGENVIALALDSRWSNAPPEGSSLGPSSIDYLEPGGIIRPIRLFTAPHIFLSDVFAKPVNVLDAARRIEVTCSIDAAVLPTRPLRLEAILKDGDRILARDSRTPRLEKTGETDVSMTLSNLGNVALWDPDTPRLYNLDVTLLENEKPVSVEGTRIGLRDARFEVDGFFLNGRRFRIFGLDRHALFPYVGFSMPERVLRRDAEILRRDFNCNFVRCSHYPQSEAFLDACDELGLMVWEELPGWQYLGNEAWRALAVRDVREMVRRDRNHPAVVIWGVRINESQNDPELYHRTKAAANSLDGSRPTSGTMTRRSTENWLQDVFAFDDYQARSDGSVSIAAPLPGVPYLVTEVVGQFNYGARKGFDAKYRRTGDVELQQKQAILHAEAHDRGAAYPRLAGVIAWCAFDYGSLMNSYDGVKCPGIADIFRIPKLGASFYRAQVGPEIRPVIEPNFYWDFGPQTPFGPGKNVAIFSNCGQLELFINGQPYATAQPDRKHFPHLKYPPFFTDLALNGVGKPELRIDGYIGNDLVLSRFFSSDPAEDQFVVHADDINLMADGSDATRLVFKVADKFGAVRPFAGGNVTFEIEGPGVIVGDNPFQLAASGGAGAVWVKTITGKPGTIRVMATHSALGAKSVSIAVFPVRS